jgi:hypothetical protein
VDVEEIQEALDRSRLLSSIIWYSLDSKLWEGFVKDYLDETNEIESKELAREVRVPLDINEEPSVSTGGKLSGQVS